MHGAQHSADRLPLTVIVPAFNEARTIAEILERLRRITTPHEVIVVDDGSTDATAEIVGRFPEVRLLRHDRNAGKGAAITTALAAVRADAVIIQDADLEYDPPDIDRVYARYAEGGVDAVYGSRNLRRNPRSDPFFYYGGVLLSVVTSLLYGVRITDEATGYKLVRTDVLRRCDVRARGFDFCPELTARLLRSGARLVEVPIAYAPRSRADGKKIRARDGVIALWVLLRERVQPPRDARPRRVERS